VVHAAGRVPILDALHLEAASVQHTARGVAVNEFLQSPSNPRVWAAGDAAASGAPRLTPVASLHAAIVTHNLLHDQKKRFDPIPIPSVVYTTPPLASVGLSEQQARDAGLPFTGNFVDTSGWYSSRRLGESCSGAKVLVHSQTGRILGAHLLGPGAEETINLFALAMRFDIPAAELGQMPFTYPTHSSDIAYLV
jgi:glutathione reductase (NADPH)